MEAKLGQKTCPSDQQAAVWAAALDMVAAEAAPMTC